jgi:hypothetical protein
VKHFLKHSGYFLGCGGKTSIASLESLLFYFLEA